MLTPKRIAEMQEFDFKTLTALTHPQIQGLIRDGALDAGEFKDDKIGEIDDPQDESIRYSLCRNPKTAQQETTTRDRLVSLTIEGLEKIKRNKNNKTDEKIGALVGQVLAKYKVNKFFDWSIEKGDLVFTANQEKIASEKAIDGCYVIRNDSETISKSAAVEGYMSLIQVEKAFRNLKTVQIESRPFFHKTDDRIRSHMFLCMLSYYVQWHVVKKLRPLFENDGTYEDRRWSLQTVIEHLKSIRRSDVSIGKTFQAQVVSTPTSSQLKILNLLEVHL